MPIRGEIDVQLDPMLKRSSMRVTARYFNHHLNRLAYLSCVFFALTWCATSVTLISKGEKNAHQKSESKRCY